MPDAELVESSFGGRLAICPRNDAVGSQAAYDASYVDQQFGNGPALCKRDVQVLANDRRSMNAIGPPLVLITAISDN